MKQKPRSGTGRWWKMRNRGTAAFETSCLISIFQNLAKLFLKRMSSEAKCCDSIRKGFGFRQLFMPWSMRNDGKGEAFVTDNGDYIVELHIEKEMEGLQVASDAILRIVGVVEQKNSSIPFRLS
ncbi:hypothetical protein V6N13_042538 [Hibiscus sabdariffa]